MEKTITAQEALDIEEAILFTIMTLTPIDLDKDTLCEMAHGIFCGWCEAEEITAIEERFNVIDAED